MSRRVLFITLMSVIAASLAAASGAAAKEVQAVTVCGVSECFTFDRGNSGGKLQLFAETGAAVSAPPRAAQWYELRTRIGGEGTRPVVFATAYVPILGLVRVNDEGGGGYAWFTVNDQIKPVLANVAVRLAPRSPASLHLTDIAPGVPAPTVAHVRPPRAERRESAAGSSWWIILPAAGAAAAGALVLVRRR